MSAGIPRATQMDRLLPPEGSPSVEKIELREEDDHYLDQTLAQERTSSAGHHYPISPTPLRPPLNPPNTPALSETTLSKQDGDSMTLSAHLTTRRSARNKSPSDNLSAASWGSQLHSSGGSFNSSDTGRSPCSNSSSDYLEPPQNLVDTDNPPYKPRRRNSVSLSMMKMVQMATTVTSGGRRKKRHRNKHQICCQNKYNLYSNPTQSDWWLPKCQTVPTASKDQKEICQGHAGLYDPTMIQSREMANTVNNQAKVKASTKARPPYRRWSSVEVGAHQVVLASTLPTSAKNPKVSEAIAKFDSHPSKTRGQPYRSSSHTRGAIDYDLLRDIRERLTMLKVPPLTQTQHLDRPSSITLRRATGGKTDVEAIELNSTPSTLIDIPVESVSTRTNDRQRHSSAVYLITDGDIEFITSRIEARFLQRLETGLSSRPKGYGSRTHSCSSHPGPATDGYHHAKQKSSSDSHACTKDAQRDDTLTTDHLQIHDSLPRRTGTRLHTKKSLHEIIWDGRKTPCTCFCPTGDYIERPNLESTLSRLADQDPLTVSSHQKQPSARDTSAQASENGRDPVNNWSGQCDLNKTSSMVHSEDFQATKSVPAPQPASNHARPTLVSSASYPSDSAVSPAQRRILTEMPYPKRRTSPKNRTLAKGTMSKDTLQDVVSFPPLPRKTTMDWYSPLPEMELAPQEPDTHQSLYDIGLDVNLGPSSSRTVTPTVSQIFLNEQSPSFPHTRGLEFNNASFDSPSHHSPDHQFDRRRSVVKPHPRAPSPIGEQSIIGSAIGSSRGEKRRESVTRNQVKRVRTIDNVHKGDHDPPTKWRRPSVFPRPENASPGEQLDSIKHWLFGPETGSQRLRKLRSGLIDETDIQAAKSPPSPKVDCKGIYGIIAGVKEDGEINNELYGGACDGHVCDDCANDPRCPSSG